MTNRPKIVLIDGHALVYRAYFALPPEMATSRGELTNAVFGFASMLINVYRDEQPDYIAIAWDVGRTFRHDAYDEYKANRAHMPDALSIQFQRIHELVQAFHIPAYQAEGYEADDVLAALARQAKEEGLDVVIVTGDTDTFQLIDPHVRVLAPRRSFGDTVVYDVQAIRERYGLEPGQLIDYKALTGDTSDNVPGVRGVGAKTATSLLQAYGTVEGIYEHLDQVKSARFRQALQEGRDVAFLSKRLVTITDEVPVALDLKASRVRPIDRDEVVEMFRQLEFRALLNRLPGQAHLPEPGPAHSQQLSLFGDVAQDEAAGQGGAEAEYQVVDTVQALDRLVARLKEARALVVDVESTSIDPMAAELVGIALASEEGRAYYLPVGHRQGRCLPLPLVAEKLGPLLRDPAVRKYAHNANYDLTVLAEHGIDVEPVVCDTMVAEWIINPESHNLGLKGLAWTRLGLEMTPIEDLIGSGKGQTTMAHVAIDQASRYACADADMTLRLASLLQEELREKALWKLFAEVEMPLVPIIVDMQRAGIKLDVAALEELGEQLGQRMEEIQAEVEGHVRHPININSTQQLSVALFDEMGLALPWMRRGKSGHYSTAADVLEKIRDRHPLVDLVLEYRQLSKLKGTYVDALPALVNQRTGRVHTSFNQAGAATGRFSSSNPNLQNIPIRSEQGREIRRAFVADEGRLLLAADYSQVELRVLAHIAQDPAMLAAFARGEDIHASTAAILYDVPLAEVTYHQRRIAKMTNFAISYGVTGYGLADRTGLAPEEASAFIDRYFRTFPAIREYIERTRDLAREQGYVETLLGRRRYFPQLSTTSRVHQNVREQAYRMAINAPVQGTAADILKVALRRLWRALQQRALRSRMILQVHDELVLEVPEEELDEVAALTVEVMEGAYELDAPLKVDVKVGRNWLDMEEYTGERDVER
ncbi:MAG: DNA polymerase I [Anaerolineae bacterium]|nr:DNA polymerase I [Anaerolineae bacterium]